MGSCVSQVEPLSEFGNRDEDGKPQRQRQCTDIFFLYFFGAFTAVVIALLLYCASIGDVNRILHGYDDCGNVCGQANKRTGSDPACVGLDRTSTPYLLERNNKTCVANCAEYGYATVFGRCVPKPDDAGLYTKKTAFWQNWIEDINACSTELVYMSFISFALIVLTIMLLRYNTEPFIWGILISGSVALILLCIGLWVVTSKTTDNGHKNLIRIYAITVSVLTVVLLLCLIVLHKRIKMIIALFKEASKAIGAIPHLLLEPIITILAFFISVVVLFYGGMLIGSAGNLQMINDNHYEYLPNNAVIFTTVLFHCGWLWMLSFFVGCQNMIVGGAISAWYFLRDKSRLNSPILYATYNLLRYHLGTVAFGSLVLMLLQLVRFFIEILKRGMRENGCGFILLCCSCIFSVFEEFVRYFTRLSYLITSMHGVPYCKGGKTGMRLILNNCISTIAFNSMGSFILFFINLLIMLITVLIGYYMLNKPGLNSVVVPLVISAAVSLFMAYCVFSVYDVALDTIFLCFCEDCEVNDGLSRPYYMSADLMLFVENSKKALEQLEAKKAAKAAKSAKSGKRGRDDTWNSSATAAPA